MDVRQEGRPLVQDRQAQHQLALIQEIRQDVKQLLREQQLTALVNRKVVDDLTDQHFKGKLENVLVYLHAEEYKFNQSRIAPALNKLYRDHGVQLRQQKVSHILRELDKAGFIAKKQYAHGHAKYGLAAYLRRQLPAKLRPRLRKQLDRIKQL